MVANYLSDNPYRFPLSAALANGCAVHNLWMRNPSTEMPIKRPGERQYMHSPRTTELLNDCHKTAERARDARMRMAEALELAWIGLMESETCHRRLPNNTPSVDRQ